MNKQININDIVTKIITLDKKTKKLERKIKWLWVTILLLTTINILFSMGVIHLPEKNAQTLPLPPIEELYELDIYAAQQ